MKLEPLVIEKHIISGTVDVKDKVYVTHGIILAYTIY